MAFEGPRQIPDPADENVINAGFFQLKDHQGSAQFVFGIPGLVQGGLSLGRFNGPVLRVGDPDVLGVNAGAGIAVERDGLHPGGGADVNLLGIVRAAGGTDAIIGSRLGVQPYAGAAVGPFGAAGTVRAEIGPYGAGVGFKGYAGAGAMPVEAYPYPPVPQPPVEQAPYVPPPGYPQQDNRIYSAPLPEPYSDQAYNRYINNAIGRILDATSTRVRHGEHTWADVARGLHPDADAAEIRQEAASLRDLNAPNHRLTPGRKLLTMDTNVAYSQARVEASAHFGLQPPQV